MNISTEFKENVRIGDLFTIRSALTDYLIMDRTFQTFDEALQYALKHLPVREEHDKAVFESDRKKWNREYLNSQKVALMINFSQERVDHIKEVIKEVLLEPVPLEKKSTVKKTTNLGKGVQVNGTGRKQVSETRVSSNLTESKRKKEVNHRNGPHNANNNVTGKHIVEEKRMTINQEEKKSDETFDYGTALIAGGILFGTAGIVAAKPLIIGVGVTIACAGGAKKLIDKK